MWSPEATAWYYYLVIAGCAIFFVLSISNTLYLFFSSKRPSLTNGPRISVLVPARDEESNIGRCLDSLLTQTYQNYEVVVYDDMSSDGTWDIVREYAQRNPAVKAVRGTELPAGWFGKPHAMQRLAQHATGEYFLFTDADTVHGPHSVSWAVTNAMAHRADVLSAYTRQLTRSFGESAVLSNIYLNTVMFIPLWLIPVIPLPFISHIFGQYIIFKASVFRGMGGYECVRNRISEDVYIGRELKRRGHRIVFLDVQKHVTCRMYTTFGGAVEGIAKNIYDFFEKHVASVFALSAFIAAGIELPVALLAKEILTGGSNLALAAAPVALFLAAWGTFLIGRKMRWYVPLLYPLFFLLLIYIGWKSVIDDTFGKGYLWKGRFVK
jgi:chlorobactene glucosyltransferase